MPGFVFGMILVFGARFLVSGFTCFSLFFAGFCLRRVLFWSGSGSCAGFCFWGDLHF